MLAIHLARLNPEILSHVEIIAPDAMPEKYRDFCSKLDLKRPPTIVVCRLEDLGTIEGMQMGGFYAPLENAIWLPKEAVEGFKNDNPNTDYIVAHELGHAKDPMTRRRFLSWGGAAAGGVAAGVGTWTIMRHLTDVPDKPEAKEKQDHSFLSSIRTPISYTASGIWSINVALKTMRTLIKATRPSTRAEEFTADDYAKQLLGLNGIVEPLMNQLIAQRAQKGQHDIARLTQNIDAQLEQKSITLTPEERKLVIALKTIQLFDSYRQPLPDIVLKDAYPDFAERLKHYQDEIRDVVKPAFERNGSSAHF